MSSIIGHEEFMVNPRLPEALTGVAILNRGRRVSKGSRAGKWTWSWKLKALALNPLPDLGNIVKVKRINVWQLKIFIC